MPSQPLIIDCDPGQDDAIAILLALGSRDDVDLLAVTAVAGNVPLARTQENARKIVALAGRADVPVYAGCDRPLVRPLVTAEYVHGKTGIDGADLPDPPQPLAEGHAAEAIIDIIRSRPEKSVTICPVGPLTNIAIAMRLAPDIVPRIGRFVLMGGAIALGNITPAAEFNIYVDPHAADIVFRSGVPLVMHGLDVTHKARCSAPRLDRIAAIDSPVSRAAYGMLTFYGKYDQTRGIGGGAPLHDPCAVAYVIRPNLFRGRDCHVEIDITGGPGTGRTLVDWAGATNQPANCRVIDDLDADGFFELLTERLGRL